MSKSSLWSIGAVCLILAGCSDPQRPPSDESPAAATEPADIAGELIRLNPAFNELISTDATIEKVAGDFIFTEGPVWDPDDGGRLLFSDIPANRVYSWSEQEGTQVVLDPVLEPSAQTGGTGGSNGLALDAEGRLILCEHGNRRISRLEDDGSRTTLADRFQGDRLNSPNDIVYHSSGAAYFTDPPYGLAQLDDDPAKEQPHNGVYRLDPDGTVTLLSSIQTRPNGVGLSPDESVLYVANSDEAPNSVIYAYPVEADLTLGEGRVFFDGNSVGAPGVFDGLTLDQAGNIYATGPGGALVLTPDGLHLGTIATPELPANIGWGDDGGTLYLTARTGLYRIRTNAAGLVYRGD